MAAETLSCPYCNSSLTVLLPIAAGQRLRCPRCHELFPLRAGEERTQGEHFAQPLDPENALPEGSETRISSDFVGVLGSFEIYRGSARGHRMANLRVILR